MKASAVSTMRLIVLGLLAALFAGSAFAQEPRSGTTGAVAALGGQSVAPGRQGAIQNPTPLAMIGRLAIGIWTRVPPPYDATASYSAAANPLP